MRVQISLDLPDATYRENTSRDTFSEWLVSQVLDAIYDQTQFDSIDEFTVTIDGNAVDGNTILTHHNGIIEGDTEQGERMNRFLNGNAVGPRIPGLPCSHPDLCEGNICVNYERGGLPC